ncbi:class D sortase [Lederbergia citri]|uniref:Class D sortase n=1 Tax=Lederbergia citri TaxID=2833580 RepID=A0A942TG42_9BACI|nr:class D sortase [Lederbergia citri]MBS4195744.1 class D sortase [Lederbergia citri]
MKLRRWLLLVMGIALLTLGIFIFVKNAMPLMKTYDTKQSLKSEVTEQPIVSAQKKPAKELYSIRPEKGEEFGTLSIPKLDATLPIFQGADEDELEKGVGHFAGSVLPGEKDNSVLSGHRDTVFRKLGDVGKGDLLIVTTSAGEFTYKVRKVRIVDADDRTVIVPKPRATLTVTTCYPFYYIGDAPQRYVLIADLIKKNTKV